MHIISLTPHFRVHQPSLHVGDLDEVDLRDGGHDAGALEDAPRAQQGEPAAGEEDRDPAGQQRHAQEEDGALTPVVAVVGWWVDCHGSLW